MSVFSNYAPISGHNFNQRDNVPAHDERLWFCRHCTMLPDEAMQKCPGFKIAAWAQSAAAARQVDEAEIHRYGEKVFGERADAAGLHEVLMRNGIQALPEPVASCLSSSIRQKTGLQRLHYTSGGAAETVLKLVRRGGNHLELELIRQRLLECA